MSLTPPRQYYIQGVTKQGRGFRPSDWAERLAGSDNAEIADMLGLENVLSELEALQKMHGDRFKPAAIFSRLIKEGRTTKEIAELLGMSVAAVDFHRNNIRKKLGLRNKKANLVSHLASM